MVRIESIRSILAVAAAVYTVAMLSALDWITCVEALAAIPRVRRTLTNAATVNTAAVSPAAHLHGKLAVVNDSFAHASAVAFVALAQTVDTRAVRSTATTGPIGADATNPQAEHKWQPSIIIEIDNPHHPQQALA
jgi:hypothetical protein